LEPRFTLIKSNSGTLKYHTILPAKDQFILKELNYAKEWEFFPKKKKK